MDKMHNKILGQVRDLPEGDSRKVVFTASTNARDRHRTVLNQEKWDLENFNRNPIIGYQHNVYGDWFREPNPDDVLGPARAWVDNGQLLVEIDFEEKDLNPLADKIFRKVKNGTLRAVSVGFLEKGEGKYGDKENGESRGQENETYYFEGQELLEVSVVNIPSNPEALKKKKVEDLAEIRKALATSQDISDSITITHEDDDIDEPDPMDDPDTRKSIENYDKLCDRIIEIGEAIELDIDYMKIENKKS